MPAGGLGAGVEQSEATNSVLLGATQSSSGSPRGRNRANGARRGTRYRLMPRNEAEPSERAIGLRSSPAPVAALCGVI